MRTADDDVDAPAVHIEVGRAQPGDGIHHQQRFVALGADQFRNPLHIMPRAGGTLCRLHVNRAHIGRQLLADFIERKSFAIRRADHFHDAPKSFGQIAPAFAELARGQHQNLVAGRSQVRDRAFHHAGTGRSQHQNVISRADEILHVRQHARVQSAEVGSAVVHGKRSHGGLRRGK